VSLTRPRSGRTVSIEGERVVKNQPPYESRRERLRTEAGGEVGRATGLFTVPRILAFDDARGEITFERLQLENVRHLLSSGQQGPELLERTGHALAAIHSSMTITEAARVQRDLGAVEANGPPVPLHGDFGIRNVFWLRDARSLAIIDWCNADWTGFTADLGPPEIDLAVFLISLFHRRIFGPWPLRRRHLLARRFLAAYKESAPFGFDAAQLRRIVTGMTPAFTRLTRERKGRLHAVGCRHALVDLNWFLGRLSNPG
jgi:aminoglycoside/choline kinase family phosphotransferase